MKIKFTLDSAKNVVEDIHGSEVGCPLCIRPMAKFLGPPLLALSVGFLISFCGGQFEVFSDTFDRLA